MLSLRMAKSETRPQANPEFWQDLKIVMHSWSACSLTKSESFVFVFLKNGINVQMHLPKVPLSTNYDMKGVDIHSVAE